MQLIASGSGGYPSANTPRGARLASVGAHVNNNANGAEVTAAASSCPTLPCTGAGFSSAGCFSFTAQQGIWQQMRFAQTFAAPEEPLSGVTATAGPPAMLKSTTSTTSSFIIGIRFIICACARTLSLLPNVSNNHPGRFSPSKFFQPFFALPILESDNLPFFKNLRPPV
jgi:hypothetical protein